MKKTPNEILHNRHIALPSAGTSKFLRFLLKHIQSKADVSYEYAFDTEEMKNKQVILLADHATRDAYKYVVYGYPFANPNIVVGYQNIFIKGLFKLLLKAGIIPKRLYQTDLKAITDMLRVLKLGGSLCLFPEGIQSASGSTHPIYAGTASLLKKAGVTVVLCKSYGSYLVKPRYKRTENEGHQEFRYEILFTPQELSYMSVDEIYEKMLERFKYNDFEWNKKSRCKYKGPKGEPLAKGIEYILYRCPKCKSEFNIVTEGDDIVCRHCGNTVTLNEYYDLIPKSENDYMPYSSVDEWFKHQRKIVGEEVKNPFCYEYECEIYDVHHDKLSFHPYYSCGEGKIKITNDKILYKGTRHSEYVELTFEVKNSPSFVFTPNQDNDIYCHDEFYSFRPKTDKVKVVKYMLLVEEAHRLVDTTWDKISGDVYAVDQELYD